MNFIAAVDCRRHHPIWAYATSQLIQNTSDFALEIAASRSFATAWIGNACLYMQRRPMFKCFLGSVCGFHFYFHRRCECRRKIRDYMPNRNQDQAFRAYSIYESHGYRRLCKLRPIGLHTSTQTTHIGQPIKRNLLCKLLYMSSNRLLRSLLMSTIPIGTSTCN